MMENSETLLEVTDLKTYFYTHEGILRAVDGISFDVKRGETLGVVGESGCGKSVTALSILQLVPYPKGRIVGGTIVYHKERDHAIDITSLHPRGTEIRSIRGNEISMIFQEPMTSLNPVYTVGNQIMEAIQLHQKVDKHEARKRAVEMLTRVRISAPEKRISEYPYQLSGGMRQRVMIAMALSCNPTLLIADEPTTALDVTIEAEILNLMRDLQEELGMSIMLITHDLGIIGDMADRVLVMYTGKIVEQAGTIDLFSNAKHPYTKGLIGSIPRIGKKGRLVPIEGTVPNLNMLPQGCHFAPRCSTVMPVCLEKEPPMICVGTGHFAKCWIHATKEGVSA